MKNLEIGQRIDVFEIAHNCYGGSFKKGEQYAEVPSQYSGNPHGRQMVCDYEDGLHLNIPQDMKQIGTLIIKTLK